MKKIWGYVSAFLGGALAVALLAWRVVGDRYSGKFKFRQKGEGNIQKPHVSLEMDKKKAIRRRKRLEKKADRLKNKL